MSLYVSLWRVLALTLNVFALIVRSVWSVGAGLCQSSNMLFYALLQEALPSSSVADGRLLPVHQSPPGRHSDVPTYVCTYCISLGRTYIRLMQSCSSFVIHGQLYTHSYFVVCNLSAHLVLWHPTTAFLNTVSTLKALVN